MPKPDFPVDLNEAGRLSWSCCVHPDSEPFGRAPQQRDVADRLGRRHEQKSSGLSRQQVEPALEGLLDPLRQRHVVWRAKPASQIRRVQSPRQLQQGERVAVCLSYETVRHALVHGSGQHRLQECTGVTLTEPADDQLSQPGQLPHLAGLTHREHHADWFRQKAARDKGECLR